VLTTTTIYIYKHLYKNLKPRNPENPGFFPTGFKNSTSIQKPDAWISFQGKCIRRFNDQVRFGDCNARQHVTLGFFFPGQTWPVDLVTDLSAFQHTKTSTAGAITARTWQTDLRSQGGSEQRTSRSGFKFQSWRQQRDLVGMFGYWFVRGHWKKSSSSEGWLKAILVDRVNLDDYRPVVLVWLTKYQEKQRFSDHLWISLWISPVRIGDSSIVLHSADFYPPSVLLSYKTCQALMNFASRWFDTGLPGYPQKSTCVNYYYYLYI